MSFSDLGLLPELLRAVTDKGYDVPSPIQVQAIPAVLSGRDVLAGAQTGTGKTAGFVLPILQRLVADTAHGSSRAPLREVLAAAHLPGVWRREHQPANQQSPQRLRRPGRNAGPIARSRAAAL